MAQVRRVRGLASGSFVAPRPNGRGIYVNHLSALGARHGWSHNAVNGLDGGRYPFLR
jgi:hypothetical protein